MKKKKKREVKKKRHSRRTGSAQSKISHRGTQCLLTRAVRGRLIGFPDKRCAPGSLLLVSWWAFGTRPGRVGRRHGLGCFWSTNFCEIYSGVPVLTEPDPPLLVQESGAYLLGLGISSSSTQVNNCHLNRFKYDWSRKKSAQRSPTHITVLSTRNLRSKFGLGMHHRG
jgi:hypothetical protein